MTSPINGQHSKRYCRETQIVSAIIATLVTGVAVAVILTHLQSPLSVAVPLGLLGGAELISLALFAKATVAKRRPKKPAPAPVSSSERAPAAESAPVPIDIPPPTISRVELAPSLPPTNSGTQPKPLSARAIVRHEILTTPIPAPSLTDPVQHRKYWNALLTPLFSALTNCLVALYRMHYGSQNSPWRHQKNYKEWLEGWTAKDEKKIQDTLNELKNVLLRNETFLTGANLIDSDRLPLFCDLINPGLDLKGTDLLYAAFLKACGYSLIPKTKTSLDIEDISDEEDVEAQHIALGTKLLFERGYEVKQEEVPSANDPAGFFKVIFPDLLLEVDESEGNLLTLLQNGQKLLCNAQTPAAINNADSNRKFLSLLFDNTKSHADKMTALTERLGPEGSGFLALFAEQGGAKAKAIKATIWTAVTTGMIGPILNCLGGKELAIPGMSEQEIKALITPIVVLFGMPLCHAVLDQTNAFKDPIKQWIDRHYVAIVRNSYAPLTQKTSAVGIFKEATKLFNEAAEQFQQVTLERYGK